ncbi:hypothetical protein VNO77_43156 [Canavalia gladiata]|uniref:Uncharacterized protein n=1 Tax=Canavalia gladiata TaxID=3824 RepID=A0AAN9PP70_CANGL
MIMCIILVKFLPLIEGNKLFSVVATNMSCVEVAKKVFFYHLDWNKLLTRRLYHDMVIVLWKLVVQSNIKCIRWHNSLAPDNHGLLVSSPIVPETQTTTLLS